MYAEVFWLILLLSAVGAACFFAGWKSARAYMGAALSVSDLTMAVAKDANSVTAALDKFEAGVASLGATLGEHTETMKERQKAVEEVLEILFNGFERAGYVGRYREAPGRQVGEAARE